MKKYSTSVPIKVSDELVRRVALTHRQLGKTNSQWRVTKPSTIPPWVSNTEK